MSKFNLRRITALIMVLVIVAGATVVGSFAGQKAAPLFTISDVKTKQGEEFDVTIKFAQDIAPASINIAALDVSLKYSSDIYTVVDMKIGDGLTSAFDKLSDGTDLHLEHGYVFNSGYKEPGEAKWSMSTVNGFTFKKDTVFAVVTLKANDVSALEGDVNLSVVVTNAMTKSFDNTTSLYTAATNKVDLDVNLGKLCSWEYDAVNGSYTLVKFNDPNAAKFTIPDTYGESIDSIKPVTKIKCGAFAYCTKLESIVIGSNAESIEPAAFFNCSSLKKVTFYSDNAVIGARAFMGYSGDFTIKCRKGSTADKYAEANGIKVEYFGNIADLSYTGLEESKDYSDGIPVKCYSLKFYDGGKTLVEGRDYKLEYENNVNVGTATILVTGMGEYVGTRTFTFEIKCPYHYVGSRYYTETAFYANCEEGGKIVKACSFCGYKNDSTKLPAKEHEKDEKIVIKEPTCTEHGKEAWTCKNCSAYIDEKTIIPIDHDVDWVVTVPATCEHTGLESFECKVCHEKTGGERTIPKKEHQVQWVVTTEATCMKNGIEEFICPYCGKNDGGEVKTKIIEARGYHVREENIVKEATCGEAGLKVVRCKDCNEIIQEIELPKTNVHTYTSQTAIFTEPTCTEPGYRILKCDVCGAEGEKSVVKAAYGHAWESQTIEQATCTKPGKGGQVCARCKEEQNTYPINALGHDYTPSSVTIVKGNCVVDGLEGVQCKTCGEIKEGTRKVIKARGYHTYSSEKVILSATCTQQGIKEYTCTGCGDVMVDIIPVSGHKGVPVPDVLPTYKHTGTDKTVCEFCGIDLNIPVPVDKVVPDLDGDKNVTSTDALMILQHATKLRTLTGAPLRNADCNGDASVNSTDALIVLQLSVKLISAD